MLFNSYEFIFIYCPIVLVGFFMIGRINRSYAATWLALSSLFFYSYWNSAYSALLVVSVIGNYIASIWIARKDTQKTFNVYAA
jgi:alginate O-acetyltransferase complex protein AlgI